MTTLKTLAATLALSLAAAGSALAYGDGVITSTRSTQQTEIEMGRYKGELTRGEYRERLAEQARIEALEQAARADGYVSRSEFREIARAQKVAQQNIEADQSNGRVSLWRRFLYWTRY